MTDSQGHEAAVPLFYVSPAQINYQLPAGLAPGEAVVRFVNRNGDISSSSILVNSVVPGLFAANSDGKGLAAGYITRVRGATQTIEPIMRFDDATKQFVAAPIDLGANDETVVLVLFGTGWRARSSLSQIKVTLGGETAQVDYAGSAPGYVGLDQLNVIVPRSLKGRGEVDIALFAEGRQANLVKAHIR